MQCNTTQSNTIQHNTTQHNEIQYNPIQNNTVQHNTTIQYETLRTYTLQADQIQGIPPQRLPWFLGRPPNGSPGFWDATQTATNAPEWPPPVSNFPKKKKTSISQTSAFHCRRCAKTTLKCPFSHNVCSETHLFVIFFCFFWEV